MKKSRGAKMVVSTGVVMPPIEPESRSWDPVSAYEWLDRVKLLETVKSFGWTNPYEMDRVWEYIQRAHSIRVVREDLEGALDALGVLRGRMVRMSLRSSAIITMLSSLTSIQRTLIDGLTLDSAVRPSVDEINDDSMEMVERAKGDR